MGFSLRNTGQPRNFQRGFVFFCRPAYLISRGGGRTFSPYGYYRYEGDDLRHFRLPFKRKYECKAYYADCGAYTELCIFKVYCICKKEINKFFGNNLVQF